MSTPCARWPGHTVRSAIVGPICKLYASEKLPTSEWRVLQLNFRDVIIEILPITEYMRKSSAACRNTATFPDWIRT